MPIREGQWNWTVLPYGVDNVWVSTSATTATANWISTATSTYTYSYDMSINFTGAASNTIADWGYAQSAVALPRTPVAAQTLTNRTLTEQAERQRARVAAVSRAEELLLTMLTVDQAADRERGRDGFLVMGSAGGVYRIRPGTAGNVDWIQADGTVGGTLCAHPTMDHHWLPEPDVHLAQLLALTTDEAAFVRVANVHRGRRPVLVAA